MGFIIIRLCLIFCLGVVANAAPNQYIEMGDMILSEKLYTRVFGQNRQRYTSLDLEKRWPDGIVPYAFEDGFRVVDGKTVTEDIEAVKNAISEIEKTTCIRFHERKDEKDYIVFRNGGGCTSYVGRIGGGQAVTLGGGCFDVPIIIHELGHAIGFLHEQNRPDRDEYITVYMDNITKSGQSQYKLGNDVPDFQNEFAYGYDSVMHYESWGFQISPDVKTMEAKDPQFQPLLDQSLHGYTKCDIERFNLLYNCTSYMTYDPSCYKPGYKLPTDNGDNTTPSGYDGYDGGYDYYYNYYNY